jgi:hypothetical protein
VCSNLKPTVIPTTDIVTPPSRPSKKYDYTIGEDVTLPFRRDATTESMMKVFESVTPSWSKFYETFFLRH